MRSERPVLGLRKSRLLVVLGQFDVREINLPALGAADACRHTHTHTERLETVCLHSWILAMAWFMALWVRNTTQLLPKELKQLLPNWGTLSQPCGTPTYSWTSIWEVAWNESKSPIECVYSWKIGQPHVDTALRSNFSFPEFCIFFLSSRSLTWQGVERNRKGGTSGPPGLAVPPVSSWRTSWLAFQISPENHFALSFPKRSHLIHHFWTARYVSMVAS